MLPCVNKEEVNKGESKTKEQEQTSEGSFSLKKICPALL
jgi:hypothetical protein